VGARPPDSLTSKGNLVIGAAVLFEEDAPEEVAFVSPHIYIMSRQEVEKRITNRVGAAKIDLKQHYWESDGCYHFLIVKDGYKAAELQIKKNAYHRELVIDLIRVSSTHYFPWNKPFTTQ
jgi:hypothetical protein